MELLRIELLRHRAGMNEAEIARRLGTSQTQLGRLLKGDRKLTLDWMRRIAKALGCHVSDLLSDVDFPDRPSKADAEFLAQVRETKSDPRDLIELLTGLDKFIVKQAARRSTRHQLDGDPAQNSQLAEIWAELPAGQRGYMLDLMRAALKTGAQAAA